MSDLHTGILIGMVIGGIIGAIGTAIGIIMELNKMLKKGEIKL